MFIEFLYSFLLFMFLLQPNVKANVDNCYSGRPWPNIEIIVPVNIRPLEINGQVDYLKRNYWSDIFLSSYLLFWPREVSNTSLRFVYDDDYTNTSDLADFMVKLEAFKSRSSGVGLIYTSPNSFPAYACKRNYTQLNTDYRIN